MRVGLRYSRALGCCLLCGVFSGFVYAQTQYPNEGTYSGFIKVSTADDHVVRSRFTTGIENREPIDTLSDQVEPSGNAVDVIYYFTELRGLNGKTVSHRWYFDGRLVAEVPFTIGGDRWRVYSSKKIMSSMLGAWQVEVTTDTGEVLYREKFDYGIVNGI